MATVTGFTAERMLEIENTTVVDGDVNGSGHLILQTREGTPIDAGSVIGPTGPRGYNGLYDRWNHQLSVTNPPNGVFSTGSLAPALATTLYFANLPASNNSFMGLFKTLRIGSMITVQSATNTDQWIQYTTTGAFVIGTNNSTVSVQVKEQGPAALAAGNVDILFTQPTAIAALNLPAGLVLANTLPVGYPEGTLPLEGQAISRTTYALLFQKWGTFYGVGDGSTTFNVPDYRGRDLMGRDTSQTEFDTMGKKGGEKAHTLTTNEIPPHTHGFKYGSHTVLWGGGSGNVYLAGGGNMAPGNPPGNELTVAQNINNATQNDGGGGQAHNNLQPYAVVQWVVTTGVGGGLYPASTGQMGKGTTAQRDGFYGVPTTDAQRVTLANGKPIWYNTEMDWEESYYAPNNLSGLTVKGLKVSPNAPAGWYPTPGNGPRALFVTTGAQAASTGSAFDKWDSGLSSIHSYNRSNGLIFMTSSNQRVTVGLAGYYDVRMMMVYPSGSGTGVASVRSSYNGGGGRAMQFPVVLQGSYGQEIPHNLDDTLLFANDFVYFYTDSASWGIGGGDARVKFEYLGPPLVT